MAPVLNGSNGGAADRRELVGAEEYSCRKFGKDDKESGKLDQPSAAGHGINEAGDERKETEGGDFAHKGLWRCCKKCPDCLDDIIFLFLCQFRIYGDGETRPGRFFGNGA